MPTTAAVTFTNQKLEAAFHDEFTVHFPGKLAASTVYQRGSLLGESVATPGTFAPYVAAGSDGSNKINAICPYACATDASGNITLGTVAAGGGEFGQTYPSIDLYIGGWFFAQDIPQSGVGGIDAAAVDGAHGFLQLRQGTIASGLVKL